MSSHEIKQREVGDVVVLSIVGYLNADAGQLLDTIFQQLFQAQKKLFILDFTHCETTNSPGVATLMDLCIRLSDDYRGKIAIFGLDPLKESFFTMVGIFKISEKASTLDEAIQKLKS